MKNNKEFINGIYEKYDECLNEKKIIKQRNLKRIANMAAVVAILFSTIIIYSEKQKEQVSKTTIGNEEIEENQINLETVGSFENFYNVIKEKYKSNNMLQLEESESITRDASEIKEAGVKKSETNTQVENVDEADIVKVDDKYIYYVSENKVVIIDAQTPETSDKIAEINYKDANFYPREIYVKNQKLVVIGNEYDNSCKTEIMSTDDTAITDREIVQNNKPKSGMIIYDISNIKEPKETRRVMIEGSYISSRMIDDNIYYVASKYIATSNIQRNNQNTLW